MIKRTVRLAGLLLPLMAAVALLVAVPVHADSDDDESKGGKAPEAAVVLLLPAVGGAAIGLRAYINHRRQRQD